MTTPPKRPMAASPQGAPLAARQSRIRGGRLASAGTFDEGSFA